MADMDIAEFLAARWDELERIATEAAKVPGRRWEAKSQGQSRENDGVLWDDDLANIIAWFDSHFPAAMHAAVHDPQYVLADITAKRAILAEHAPADFTAYGDRLCRRCRFGDDEPGRDELHHWVPWPCRTACLLAAPFAAHPEFDPSWRLEP
jgi:hypothetical protein